MKRLLDISRPDLLFAICWGTTVVLANVVPVAFSVDPDKRVLGLIYANIASFFVIYTLVKMLSGKARGANVDAIQRGSWDEKTLRLFLRKLLMAWALLYIVTIVYSGGLPIVWLVVGSGKSYADFGVPTLTGFLNMMRAFALSGALLLYLQTGRRKYLLLPLFMLFTAVCEVSRGAIMVLLSHALGIVFLRRSPTLWGIVRLVTLMALFVIGFGILGEFRGSSLDTEGLAGDQAFFVDLPVGVFFVFIYMVSPLNNLYYAADTITPSFTPYYTSMALFPSVIRAILFPQTDQYPVELALESFNATTFYSPLVADFGWVGAFILVCFIQWVCSYLHVRARQGSQFHTLAYPAFFMSVLLSVFYMYFFALVTVLYPVLASIFLRFRRSRLQRRERIAASLVALPHPP